jgi:hypothetical protein
LVLLPFFTEFCGRGVLISSPREVQLAKMRYFKKGMYDASIA